MATAERRDPYRTFNFQLEIDGVPLGAFAEASGLTAEGGGQRDRHGVGRTCPRGADPRDVKRPDEIPIMPSYVTPGVYYERADAGDAAVSPLRTDIAAFVGIARRGPLDVAVPVDSWRQF